MYKIAGVMMLFAACCMSACDGGPSARTGAIYATGATDGGTVYVDVTGVSRGDIARDYFDVSEPLFMHWHGFPADPAIHCIVSINERAVGPAPNGWYVDVAGRAAGEIRVPRSAVVAGKEYIVRAFIDVTNGNFVASMAAESAPFLVADIDF